MVMILLLSLSWRRIVLGGCPGQTVVRHSSSVWYYRGLTVVMWSCLYVVVGDIDLIWTIQYPCGDIDLIFINHCVNIVNVLDHTLGSIYWCWLCFINHRKKVSLFPITPPSSLFPVPDQIPDVLQTCVNEVWWMSRCSHPGNLNTINTIDCNVGSLQLGAGKLPKKCWP